MEGRAASGHSFNWCPQAGRRVGAGCLKFPLGVPTVPAATLRFSER